MKKMLTGLIAGVSVMFTMTISFAAPPNDTFVVGLPTDTKGLEPAQISSRHTANIMKHMFGTLFFISETGTIDPNLAESYSVSDDGKDITFTLKKGLTCHDGEPLTAEDVAYTFNRVVDPELAFVGNSAGFVFPSIDFQGARADSELDVTISMGAPNHIGLGLISEVYVHCKDSYSKMSKEEAAENPIGSGNENWKEKWLVWVYDRVDSQLPESVDSKDDFVACMIWKENAITMLMEEIEQSNKIRAIIDGSEENDN